MQEEFKTSLKDRVSSRLFSWPTWDTSSKKNQKLFFPKEVENWERWCIFLEKNWTCNFLLCTDSVRDFCMRILGKFREKHFGVCILHLEIDFYSCLQLARKEQSVYPFMLTQRHSELRNSTNRWLNNAKPFLLDSSSGLRHSHDAWRSPR